MADASILMGDVSGSGKLPSERLQHALRHIVATVNKTNRGKIQSPLTITLGDEFQGIAKNFRSLVEIIFAIERKCLDADIAVQMHYVGLIGVIETSVNKKVAHGMLGPGLTEARAKLTSKRRDRPDFQFHSNYPREDIILNSIMAAISGLRAQWRPDDYQLIAAMLESQSDQQIADKFSKNRSQIWKRRKTLMVAEYQSLRNAAIEVAELIDLKSQRT